MPGAQLRLQGPQLGMPGPRLRLPAPKLPLLRERLKAIPLPRALLEPLAGYGMNYLHTIALAQY